MHLPWLLFECDNKQYILIFVADAQGVKVSADAVTVTDLFADVSLPMHLPWLLFECDNNQYILIFVADGQGVKVSAAAVTVTDLFADANSLNVNTP